MFFGKPLFSVSNRPEMSTPEHHAPHKTVLELDLAAYSDIASALEENLDVDAVKIFQDQIQSFVDIGLKPLNLQRNEVVFATAGDNALLIFDSAAVMHEFARIVQDATFQHNRRKSVESAKRWFRMGAATGAVLIMPEERRIVGTTVARAVRLEAAADKGEILIDTETYEALPPDLKKLYGPEEIVPGKRDEQFTVRRLAFVSPKDRLAHSHDHSNADVMAPHHGHHTENLQPNPSPAGNGQGRTVWAFAIILLILAGVGFAAYTLGWFPGQNRSVSTQTAPPTPAPPAATSAPVQPVVSPRPVGPKNLVVPDQYTNIQSAIMAASPGDTVSIKPGVYVGQVSLRSGIRLIGDSMETVTLRTAPSDKVLVCAGVQDVYISNLTIEHDGKTAADNKLRNCVCYIAGSSSVEVSSCRIQNSDGHGVRIADCSPKITDCVVQRNTWSGIEINGKESDPTIAHNHCADNGNAGILLVEGAGGIIEENQCTQNQENGIFAAGLARELTLRSNQCHDNQASGIHLMDGSTGLAEGNNCFQNHAAGISIMGARTAPVLKGNQCHHNRTSGIMFQRNSSGVADGNRCSANLGSGITVMASTATLKANQCSENTLNGITFTRGGTGSAVQNVCANNKQSGIAVFEPSNPDVNGNTCRNNAEWGIWCQTGSTPSVHTNEFDANTLGDVTTTGTVR